MHGIARMEGGHWLIRRYLSCLQSLLDDAAIVGPWRPDIEAAARFLRKFVAEHYVVQEEALFSLLRERGFDADSRGRPLVHDHDVLNGLCGGLDDLLQREDPVALEASLDVLQRVVAHLEEHLAEELHGFAELRDRLSEEDVRELEGRMDRACPGAEGTLDRGRALLALLGVPPDEPLARSA